MSRSLFLLSGGLDSACGIAMVRPSASLCIDYGQSCSDAEISSARAISKALGIPFFHINADCSGLGVGDLTGKPQIAVAPTSEWWPFRNQLLATLGGAFAVTNGYDEVLFGTIAPDGFHADGRIEFFDQLNLLMEQQEGHVGVAAPLIALSGPDLVRASGLDMQVLALTHSCHVSNIACGQCRGCEKRIGVLRECGLLEDSFHA